MPDVYPYGRDAPEGTYFAERRGGFDRGEGGPGEEWDPGSANNSAAAAAAAELARMWASAPFGTEPDTENWPGMYSAFHYATVAQNLIDDAFPPGTGTNGYYLVADDAMPSGVKWAAAPLFTDVASGMVPGSGGGTTNFLRADGTWAAPSAGGAGTWGSITGDIADQLDLQSALGTKALAATTLTAGTGLTGGGDLTGNRSFAFDTTWGDARYAQLSTGYLPLAGGTMTGVIQTKDSSPGTPAIHIADSGWIVFKANDVGGSSATLALEPNHPYNTSSFLAFGYDTEVQSGWDGGGYYIGMSAPSAGLPAMLHVNKWSTGTYAVYRDIAIGWGPANGLSSTGLYLATNSSTGAFNQAIVGGTSADGTGAKLRVVGNINVTGDYYKNGSLWSPGGANLSYNASTRVLASDSGTDATLPLFTDTEAGLTPLSGGGTTNFLRADGTWAAPPGSSGTDLSYTAATRVLASSTGADATLPTVSDTEAGLAPATGGGTSNFLRADGTWAAPAGGSTDLSYTASTRVLASSTGADATLPLFTSGDAGLAPASGGGTTNYLRADGTWDSPAGTGSVATDAIWDTKGDLAVATGANTASKLAVGSDGQVLTADSAEATGVKWATPSAGGAVSTDTIWDAKGDLAVGTGSNTASKVTVGGNGLILIADSAESAGVRWGMPIGTETAINGVGGALGWWSAQDLPGLGYAADDPVVYWPNRMKAGADAWRGSRYWAPVYKATRGANSQPCVEWTVGGQKLSLAHIRDLCTQTNILTIITIMCWDGSSQNVCPYFSKGSDQQYEWYSRIPSTGTNFNAMWTTTGGTHVAAPSHGSNPAAGTFYFSVTQFRSSSLSSQYVYQWRNGGAKTSSTTLVGGTNGRGGSEVLLSAGTIGATAGTFEGRVCEIAIFPYALTNANLDSVASTMCSPYSISTTAHS